MTIMKEYKKSTIATAIQRQERKHVQYIEHSDAVTLSRTR